MAETGPSDKTSEISTASKRNIPETRIYTFTASTWEKYDLLNDLHLADAFVQWDAHSHTAGGVNHAGQPACQKSWETPRQSARRSKLASFRLPTNPLCLLS